MCAATPYSILPAGEAVVGDLKIDVAEGWNTGKPNANALFPAAVWTRDGPFLDRVVVYAGVSDNQRLMNDRKSAALPRFRAEMTSDEWMAVIVATLATVFGDEPALVETSNVRPQSYGRHSGIVFEVAVTPVEIAYYRSTIGGFVANEKLYLIMYIAADPYYYDKHREAALRMIASARLRDDTDV